MRLRTNTYVKIALILLLCLLVCSFFGGCMRTSLPFGSPLFMPGGVVSCMGQQALEDVADGVRSSSYETTTEGSHFEVNADEVNAVELNWLAGEVSVTVAPDGDTGGKILVDEVVEGGSAPVMVCGTNDGVLAIDYMEGRQGLAGCSANHFGHKNLTVQLPASLADRLGVFELEAASGRYDLTGLACEVLELGVASGEVNAAGLTAERAELSVASGRLHVQGAITEKIGLDQASGDVSFSLPDTAPAEVMGSMASGSLVLELPADTRLSVDMDKTSGSFNNELASPVTGEGQPCDLSFDMISGNFMVRPAA